MHITMVGHSTIVIATGDQRIVIDPWFGVGNPAYRRIRKPGMTREAALRDVSLVLLSHNHFDHVDPAFFRSVPMGIPLVAPRQTAWLTGLIGARDVTGIAPWQSLQFGDVKVTAVPAAHIGVTVGYVIEGERKTVYFAADTWYRPFMKQIAEKFTIDVALMPVATYRIPMTMGEEDAVRAALDLRPKVVIPIHLGLEPRSPLMRTGQTATGFDLRLRQAQPAIKVVHLNEGDAFEV